MADDPFGKWWPCLKKHLKRRMHWLPEAKRLQTTINGRDLRYFTLCARPMIDVYMMVQEGVLPYDDKTKRISGAYFCECVEDNIGEMRELIGAEEAGSCGFLEDLVLFQDIAETKTLTDEKSIAEYIDQVGEKIAPEVEKAIKLKRAHLNLKEQFPFDFINLDYCDPYYNPPPNVLRVHQAVKQIIEWQSLTGKLPDKSTVTVKEFVLAVTCRTDQMLDAEAEKHLREIVQANCADHATYRSAVGQRGTEDIEGWQRNNPLDFFMAAWPKEIAQAANTAGWDIEIQSHSYYERTDGDGVPYHMICLVAKFTKADRCTTYLPAALASLDAANRDFIAKIDENSPEGRKLLGDLRRIVNLRNEQARVHGVSELPDPLAEIVRLRAEKIAI